jgi:ABC-type transport system substrate-binding protein
MGIVLNTAAAPLSDVRVRRSFVDSLDRMRIVAGLVQDQGSLLNAIPPSSSSPFATYGALGRARTTLADDGWSGSPIRSKGGTKLSFTVAVADSDGLGSIIARALTFQAVRAGIDVQAISLPVDELMRTWLTGGRFRAALLTWRDPPGGAARARFAGGGRSITVTRIDDAELNARLLDGRFEPRMAALVPVIPLSTLAVTLAWSARVTGPVANAEADGPFWNIAAWAAA